MHKAAAWFGAERERPRVEASLKTFLQVIDFAVTVRLEATRLCASQATLKQLEIQLKPLRYWLTE
jgi:hypothetical protein